MNAKKLFTKKVIASILAIIIAICSVVYKLIDDDPNTKPEVGPAIETVKDNVEIIKDEVKSEPAVKDETE